MLAALMVLAACSRPTPIPAVPAERLAIRIEQEGLYGIDAQALAPFGWNLATLDAEGMQLRQGQTPVPFRLTGSGQDRRLVFYGNVQPTRSAGYSIYYLERTEDPGPSLTERSVAPSSSLQPSHADRPA